MGKYLYYWIIFIVILAFRRGYKHYIKAKKLGYDEDYYLQTGEKIGFNGGIKEMILSTIAASLGLVFSPFFIVIESIKFIPIALFIYFTSK